MSDDGERRVCRRAIDRRHCKERRKRKERKLSRSFPFRRDLPPSDVGIKLSARGVRTSACLGEFRCPRVEQAGAGQRSPMHTAPVDPEMGALSPTLRSVLTVNISEVKMLQDDQAMVISSRRAARSRNGYFILPFSFKKKSYLFLFIYFRFFNFLFCYFPPFLGVKHGPWHCSHPHEG